MTRSSAEQRPNKSHTTSQTPQGSATDEQDVLDAYVDHEPETDGVHDESVTDAAAARPDYAAVIERIEAIGADELAVRVEAAEKDLLEMGVTINSDEGNRPYPIDIVPRIISADRWAEVSAGVEQRVRALELFLRDVYGPGEILKAGRVSERILQRAPGYSENGRLVPSEFVRAGVCGLDLVSPDSGEWIVLEDNLRMPGGIGMTHVNRTILERHFAEVMPKAGTLRHPDESYPLLRETLQACAAAVSGADEAPCLCMVSPGETDSTWYEQQFVSERIGAALVTSDALVVEDGALYRLEGDERHRVHVLNPRMGEDDLFAAKDAHGRPLGETLRDVMAAGAVSIVNAPGNGLADDKAIYALVPEMIDFYLGEKPLIGQVPTLLCAEEKQREEVLDRLGELVVKPIDGYGGADITVGPECSPEELETRRQEIRENPEHFIAQDIIPISTLPRFVDGSFTPSHVDLRAFVLQRPDPNDSSQTLATTSPAALTRVAPVGTMVVNVSAGGGGKDTWIQS